jgi:spore coat polysaccharide biosynthesis protein SpsF
MLGTLGIVQVRSDASEPHRRRGNRDTRNFGGKPLLEWVVRRVTDSQRLDGVIVVLGDSPAEREIAALVPPDVPVFFSDSGDALARLTDALQEYEANAVVRVCVDSLFIDPVLIDRLVCSAESQHRCDYVGYCQADGRPAILSPLGVFAEWCRADSLREANRLAEHQADRDQVTRYIYSHPERFNIRLIPVPAALDRDDVRLAIESEEDWEHAQTIYDALGPDDLDWQGIAGLLDHHPALRQRMADLNRSYSRT